MCDISQAVIKLMFNLIFWNKIDTAAVYRNEADIGNSLKQILPSHGLSRADIFITSKLCESFKHKPTICDILEMLNDFRILVQPSMVYEIHCTLCWVVSNLEATIVEGFSLRAG